jgi:hypothetical protein
MRTATVYAGEEHGRYVGQVYQEYYAGLRYYFLSQFGDASEADACVRETVSRFFSMMEGRRWEAKRVPEHLLNIAGLLCAEKLAAKTESRTNRLGLDKAAGLLHKIRDGVIQPVKERLELSKLFHGGRGGDGRPRAKRVSPLGRAPLASA